MRSIFYFQPLFLSRDFFAYFELLFFCEDFFASFEKSALFYFYRSAFWLDQLVKPSEVRLYAFLDIRQGF